MKGHVSLYVQIFSEPGPAKQTAGQDWDIQDQVKFENVALISLIKCGISSYQLFIILIPRA